MNGHPRARMKLILRQYETEVKIFNSRWFPASIYRFKCSNIASQGSNMKKTSKKSILQKIFLDFSIDPGGAGSHQGGSRTDSGAEKHQKNNENYKNYNFPPKIIIIIFRRATTIIIIMAAGRQKDEI